MPNLLAAAALTVSGLLPLPVPLPTDPPSEPGVAKARLGRDFEQSLPLPPPFKGGGFALSVSAPGSARGL